MVDDNTIERIIGGDTRRAFIKKGALATVGAGAVASGAATAQDGQQAPQQTDQQDDNLGEGWKALTFVDNFHPSGQFTIVSGVVEWVPNYGEIDSSWFSDYNTRHIRWQNTDEVVPLFVAQDANIGQFDQDLGFVPDADDDADQPQLYQMNREWAPFSDSPRLLTVNVSPVGEEEEDAIFQNEEWWQADDGNAGGNNADCSKDS